MRESSPGDDGSISVSDWQWLLDKAALGLELDAFVTTEADRDRLAKITEATEKGCQCR